MRIKQLSILNIGEIAEFINRFHYPQIRGIHSHISILFRNGGYVLVPCESDGMMVLTNSLGETKAEGHIYIAEHLRGLQALRFTKACYEWGWKNTPVESVINKVVIEDHRLRMFMGMLKMEELSRDDEMITYIRYKEEK